MTEITSNKDELAEYHLHVDILVPKDDADTFEQLAKKFLAPPRNGFQHLDPDCNNELLLALRGRAFEYPHAHERRLSPTPSATNEYYEVHKGEKPAKHEPLVRFVQLWRVPDLRDLDIRHMMLLCADDPLYRSIDSLVVSEIQNYAVRVRLRAPFIPPKDGTGHYIRVIKRFEAAKAGQYLGSLGALLPALERKGWYNVGVFQLVTGPLNTIIEFWQAPRRSARLEEFHSDLAGDDWKEHTSNWEEWRKLLVEPYLQIKPTIEFRELFERYYWLDGAGDGDK